MDDETVLDLMEQAAEVALAKAPIEAADVDMLIGWGSVSQNCVPNDLCLLHQRLGLSRRCRCLPVASDYTNFHDGMKLANDLIEARTIQNALVVVGNNWTQHMDYHEAVCVAAGDAAGAAVVGRTADKTRFRLVDWENETHSKWFDAFRMRARPHEDQPAEDYGNFTTPLMKLGEQGPTAVAEFGLVGPPAVTMTLLKRHQLTGADISLVAHQTSPLVFDAWNKAIQPAYYANTMTDFADMVNSSVPVNLSYCYEELPTDKLVLLGVGMEMHATAMLYERDPADPA